MIVTITHWQCDRCGVLAKTRPTSYTGDWSIEAKHSFTSAAYDTLVWKELCPKCRVAVGEQVDAMREAARLAREETLLARTLVLP